MMAEVSFGICAVLYEQRALLAAMRAIKGALRCCAEKSLENCRADRCWNMLLEIVCDAIVVFLL